MDQPDSARSSTGPSRFAVGSRANSSSKYDIHSGASGDLPSHYFEPNSRGSGAEILLSVSKLKNRSSSRGSPQTSVDSETRALLLAEELGGVSRSLFDGNNNIAATPQRPPSNNPINRGSFTARSYGTSNTSRSNSNLPSPRSPLVGPSAFPAPPPNSVLSTGVSSLQSKLATLQVERALSPSPAPAPAPAPVPATSGLDLLSPLAPDYSIRGSGRLGNGIAYFRLETGKDSSPHFDSNSVLGSQSIDGVTDKPRSSKSFLFGFAKDSSKPTMEVDDEPYVLHKGQGGKTMAISGPTLMPSDDLRQPLAINEAASSAFAFQERLLDGDSDDDDGDGPRSARGGSGGRRRMDLSDGRYRVAKMVSTYLLWITYAVLGALCAFIIWTVATRNEGSIDVWAWVVAAVFVNAAVPLALYDINMVRPRVITKITRRPSCLFLRSTQPCYRGRLMCSSVTLQHMIHYVRPQLQRYYIRILWMVRAFA